MIGEWIRFCIVGALAAAMNTAIIVLMTEFLGLHYLLSLFACFLIVTLFAFFMNRGWSFRIKGAGRNEELKRYILVASIGIVLSLWLSWGMVQLGVPYYAAVFASAIILAPYNFLAHRFFSFQVKHQGKW